MPITSIYPVKSPKGDIGADPVDVAYWRNIGRDRVKTINIARALQVTAK
jgi:hypothetical protein